MRVRLQYIYNGYKMCFLSQVCIAWFHLAAVTKSSSLMRNGVDICCMENFGWLQIYWRNRQSNCLLPLRSWLRSSL
jgi:hypothetical protein